MKLVALAAASLLNLNPKPNLPPIPSHTLTQIPSSQLHQTLTPNPDTLLHNNRLNQINKNLQGPFPEFYDFSTLLTTLISQKRIDHAWQLVQHFPTLKSNIQRSIQSSSTTTSLKQKLIQTQIQSFLNSKRTEWLKSTLLSLHIKSDSSFIESLNAFWIHNDSTAFTKLSPKNRAKLSQVILATNNKDGWQGEINVKIINGMNAYKDSYLNKKGKRFNDIQNRLYENLVKLGDIDQALSYLADISNI